MKTRSSLLLLPLAALLTSCSLYSKKAPDFVAVSYALAARADAVRLGKNQDNTVVNKWLGDLKKSAEVALSTPWGKVDLSQKVITPAVRTEVKNQLGSEPNIRVLSGLSGEEKSVRPINAEEWEKWLEEALKILGAANSWYRGKQYDALTGLLDRAKWGEQDLPST